MTRTALCEDAPTPSRDSAKALGAYYTDAQIADFLVWWAVRSPQDRVLDPSFGGGVFLQSACQRLRQLRGTPGKQVFGVEVDPEVHQCFSAKLAEDFGVPREHLFLADFFRLDQSSVPEVQVVVGNPPFIRYQRFAGEVRKRALARSKTHGVRLPELCSSWAPFLVCSAALLQSGGRLAMVLPMEIAHAAYARPVLEHLRRSFGKVIFLTFRRKLFSGLSENTLLLLAEDKDRAPAEFSWRDLAHAGMLAAVRRHQDPQSFNGVRQLDAEAISEGRERLIEQFISREAHALYRELKRGPLVQRLGDLADVGIGYVTGANEFFHLDPDEAGRREIPKRFLRPAVRRGRALSGLRFTAEDWQEAVRRGEAGCLLHIQKEENLPVGVQQYLRHGEALGVPAAYKCRTRSPWFRVPHVYLPDAFLSYMSGTFPRLVANDACAVAPNSLHVLRLHPHGRMTRDALASLWQTSLTRLSVEIEGHALGGGMLKLEPTEAENVLVPVPQGIDSPWLADFTGELDALARGDDEDAAQARADTLILRKNLGLSRTDCDLLRRAAEMLRSRRHHRSGSA